jgi:hypothetical protein
VTSRRGHSMILDIASWPRRYPEVNK